MTVTISTIKVHRRVQTHSNQEENMNKLSYSITEVSSITGLGRTKIYELINCRILKARKLGRRIIILDADLKSFLDDLENYTTASE